MATRMQQRRGTAQQWTDADPILAAGEIGFETDTSQFKIGDGVNAWSDLSYFKNLEDLGGTLDDYIPLTQRASSNGVATLDGTGQIPVSQLGNLIDGAPAALNTLNEIATMLGDGSTLGATVVAAISNVEDGVAGVQTNLNTHANDSTNVHGIADTSLLATQDFVNTTSSGNVSTHNLDTTGVHGIADTAELALQSDITDALTAASTDAQTKADAAVAEAASTADTKIATHNSDTTDVHGIANTANLATNSSVSTAVSDHNSDSTNVHGIADTADLATKSYADQAETDAITAAGTAADTKISTAVAALTKSSVGLGNVDNTSDANKPVSTATQTALDLKANLNAPTFTGTVTSTNNLVVDGNLTVNGTTFNASSTSITIEDNLVQLAHQNSGNTVDLGLVVAYNDGAAKHAGIARDVSDDKWKLFKGVTTEPTTTVNFGQGSLDNLAVAALEATTVTPSSGIVFSDGTQVKAGVPSITTFATAISSSATLAAGEQDKFVPLTGAVTITLPATGYSTGQSIDFYQESGTGAAFASTNSVVGTPGLKFRTTNSVVTAMKTASGWLVFGDLSA
jgi:hypothetical protein